MTFPPLFVSLAVAGLLFWAGPAAASATTAGACGVVSPRYEPKTRAQAETPVRFQGGAKLTAPLAAPCPLRVHAVNA